MGCLGGIENGASQKIGVRKGHFWGFFGFLRSPPKWSQKYEGWPCPDLTKTPISPLFEGAKPLSRTSSAPKSPQTSLRSALGSIWGLKLAFPPPFFQKLTNIRPPKRGWETLFRPQNRPKPRYARHLGRFGAENSLATLIRPIPNLQSGCSRYALALAAQALQATGCRLCVVFRRFCSFFSLSPRSPHGSALVRLSLRLSSGSCDCRTCRLLLARCSPRELLLLTVTCPCCLPVMSL